MRIKRVGWVPGAVMAAVGLIQLFEFHRYHGYVTIITVAARTLPAALLFAAHWLAAKNRRRARTAWIVAALLIAPAWLFTDRVAKIDWEWSPVTASNQYEQLLRYNQSRYGGSWVSHFPLEIPPDARNLVLWYQPPIMQGGPWFEIHYKRPPDQVIAMLREYQLRRHMPRESVGGTLNGNSRSVRVRDERSRGWVPIPPDFQVFHFGSAAQGVQEVSWSAGVAISTRRNEIIHWGEASY